MPPDKEGGSKAQRSNNTNTRPITEYSWKDKGPFIVYIETPRKNNPNNLGNIGKFSHLKLAREIFDLHLSDVKNIKNKGLNRVAVEFINYTAANQFRNNKNLIDKGYEVYIPFNFVTCKAIVREVDLDLPEELLKEYFTSSIEIMSIKRMNRKVLKEKNPEYVPTGR